MSTNSNSFYDFGPFRVDKSERLLLRGEDVVPLTPKVFELLLVLVESSGHVFTKDELMKRVWPDSFVEEANLSHNVYKLREALGDGRNGEKYIETMPRRGYRFVAKVTGVSDGGVDLIVEEHSRARIVIEEDDAEEKLIATKIAPAEQRVALPGLAGRRTSGKQLLLIGGCISLVGLVIGLFYFLGARESHSVTGTPMRSIAVLPFKPLVLTQRNESLEMGMAETLITRLSKINQLVVRPTSSVRKYAGAEQDSLAAGRELRVDSVLDGNVQQVGDQLRLTVRLVRVSDGLTVWADKFDTKFTDIFAVQDAISEKVAGALALKLTGQEQKGLSKRYTDNAEAYGLYLKGRFHWSTFGQADLLTSINYFNAALEKDPSYALAYAGLADSYSVIAIYGPLSATEANPKSREAALKALKLDEDLAEAHAALGAAKLFYDWDWSGAAAELQRAQELDPNSLSAHSLYAYYLAAMGKVDEALGEQRRAKELAPEWHITNREVLLGLFEARRYDEAIEQSRQVVKLDPNDYFAHCILGQCYAQQGKYEEAKVELERAVSLRPERRALTALGSFYASTGKKAEALKIVEQLQEKPTSLTPLQVAEIYVGLGDKAQAFVWLGKAYDQRSPFLWRIKVTPQFDSVRSDARYIELLRRMNLAP